MDSRGRSRQFRRWPLGRYTYLRFRLERRGFSGCPVVGDQSLIQLRHAKTKSYTLFGMELRRRKPSSLALQRTTPVA